MSFTCMPAGSAGVIAVVLLATAPAATKVGMAPVAVSPYAVNPDVLTGAPGLGAQVLTEPNWDWLSTASL